MNYKKTQKSLGRAIGAVNKESKLEQARARQLSRMRAETVELPDTAKMGQHVSMGFVNYVNGVPVSVQLNESADFVMNNNSKANRTLVVGTPKKPGEKLTRKASQYHDLPPEERSGPPSKKTGQQQSLLMLMNQRGPPPSVYQQIPSVVNNSFSWKQPGSNRDRNSHLTASQGNQGTSGILRDSMDKTSSMK